MTLSTSSNISANLLIYKILKLIRYLNDLEWGYQSLKRWLVMVQKFKTDKAVQYANIANICIASENIKTLTKVSMSTWNIHPQFILNLFHVHINWKINTFTKKKKKSDKACDPINMSSSILGT